jgi:hypothetical protein
VSACHCTHRYRPDAPLAHPRWHRWAAAVLAGLPALAAASVFQAEGSDTGAGLGARQVALGGTGVASAEDVHAVCYKPGGSGSNLPPILRKNAKDSNSRDRVQI